MSKITHMVSEQGEGVSELFPFPSHVNVKSFVSVKLNDENYLAWKTQVEALLRSQKLLGFVNGGQEQPVEKISVRSGNEDTEVSNPDYEAWLQTDQLVMSWLFSTLSESVLGYTYGCISARDVWTVLAENFNQCSVSREYDLLASLQMITKGDMELRQYLREFKNICDQLSSIGKPVSENMKIFRLLQSLGKQYEAFATSIQTSMHRPPVPTYSQVVSQLIAFDTRIKKYTTVSVDSHMAFQAQFSSGSHNYGQGSGFFSRGNYGNRGRGRGGYSTKGRGFTQQVSTWTGGQKVSQPPTQTPNGQRPVCQICGRPGHIALRCWNRFDHAYQSTDVPQALAAMHISGPSTQEWYPDSGASSHITNTPTVLEQSQPYHGAETVLVADGNFLPITHVGSTSLPTPTEGVATGKKA